VPASGDYATNTAPVYNIHRWALSPISVMSDIGLRLYRTVRYRTERLKIFRIFRYRTKVFSHIRYLTSKFLKSCCTRGLKKQTELNLHLATITFESFDYLTNKFPFCLCMWRWVQTFLMSDSGLSDIGLSCFIIGLIRYRTEGLQSDKFFPISDKAISMSDIGDKNIWCRAHLW
jgi:hypothetical protein